MILTTLVPFYDPTRTSRKQQPTPRVNGATVNSFVGRTCLLVGSIQRADGNVLIVNASDNKPVRVVLPHMDQSAMAGQVCEFKVDVQPDGSCKELERSMLSDGFSEFFHVPQSMLLLLPWAHHVSADHGDYARPQPPIPRHRHGELQRAREYRTKDSVPVCLWLSEAPLEAWTG